MVGRFLIEFEVIWVGPVYLRGHPVHQIEIHVVGLKVLQRFLEGLFDIVKIRGPNFGGDEQIFSLNMAFFDYLGNYITDDVLSFINGCSVYQTNSMIKYALS